MSLEELASVLTARARRSIRRGFNTETSEFFERLKTTPKEKVVRTHCRDGSSCRTTSGAGSRSTTGRRSTRSRSVPR